MTSPRPEKLLNCPFCGSEDIDAAMAKDGDGNTTPGCFSCGAVGPTESLLMSRRQAWNRRAACPEPAEEAVAWYIPLGNSGRPYALIEWGKNRPDSGDINAWIPLYTRPRDAAGKESGPVTNEELEGARVQLSAAPAGRGDAQHEWRVGMIKRHPDWITCAKCGVVKQHSGKNGLCKGVVKVGLREATAQGATPSPRSKVDQYKVWIGPLFEGGWYVPASRYGEMETELNKAEAKLSQRPDQQELVKALESVISDLAWCCEHSSECLGDFPQLLASAKAHVKHMRAAAAALSKEGGGG